MMKFTCCDCGRVQLLTPDRPYAYKCNCSPEGGTVGTFERIPNAHAGEKIHQSLERN